ncbi:prolipoprotein diacylglyceryl transferase family protein [Actinotalea solisilvae]|uniref:prolipoprotein diacylglyceryl transferase family protein n=1 Tax=Actinotalea solisilvae TaxID=2072922 RepID=UPI0018F1DD24|nr:prolipoprotein diacylglyceryl transferase family protein [Actinotalea solisilvae]
MPTLARVGGAAGTAGALEFVKTPLSALGQLMPHALGMTYWFDAPTTPGPHKVVLRLTGRRLDVDHDRVAADDFVTTTTLSGIEQGSGRIALTHRVAGKAAGRWHVTADAVALPEGADHSEAVRLPSAERVGVSTFAPVAFMRAPGVVLGSWPAMVGLGVLLALVVQNTLARAHGLPPGRLLLLALVASLLGAVGARAYYRLTHRKERGGVGLAGMSVQGFVIVATATFVVGGALQGAPVGHLLDGTIPALLVGQGVGRLGCLLAGCCAGNPTLSRWAIWSSDRRVAARRVPVQLMESAAAGALALVAAVISAQAPSPGGLLFAAGVAAYVAVRQLLFPLRGIPRSTPYGRQATLLLALVVLLGTMLVARLT